MREREFRPNSTPKVSSKGKDCLSLIYYNLTLFLVDVGLKFFPAMLMSSDA